MNFLISASGTISIVPFVVTKKRGQERGNVMEEARIVDVIRDDIVRVGENGIVDFTEERSWMTPGELYAKLTGMRRVVAIMHECGQITREEKNELCKLIEEYRRRALDLDS